MPAAFDFQIPPETQRRLADLLSPEQLRKAQFQIVLKVTGKLKTLISRKIRDQIDLKKSDLEDPKKKYLSVTKPRGDPPEGSIAIKSKRLPYVLFPHRPTEPDPEHHHRDGVTIKISKSRTVILDHAFVAIMPSGHTGIFLRSKRSNQPLVKRGSGIGRAQRLHIAEETTLSLPEIMKLDKVWESIQFDTQAELRKQAESQLSRFLKGDYRPLPESSPE